jgi:hypothetical protein
MKRAMLVAVGGFLMLAFASPGEAQIPARGLSALICLAGVNGNDTYQVGPSGQLVIVVSGDNGATATVSITHGADGSSHLLTYSDEDGSGTLNCGDIIASVS